MLRVAYQRALLPVAELQSLSCMADLTPLTTAEIAVLAAEHSALPLDYLSYLREVGWGTASSGHMIYSDPILPVEVYPRLNGETNRILIGDDTQGYCLGYDFSAKQYGEYSPRGEWSSFQDGFNLAAHLTNAG